MPMWSGVYVWDANDDPEELFHDSVMIGEFSATCWDQEISLHGWYGADYQDAQILPEQIEPIIRWLAWAKAKLELTL